MAELCLSSAGDGQVGSGLQLDQYADSDAESDKGRHSNIQLPRQVE